MKRTISSTLFSRLSRKGSSSSAISTFLLSVVAQNATGSERPSPLICGRDNFSLPQVLAEDEHDVPGSELGGEIDEALAAGDMKIANRFIEIERPVATTGKDTMGRSSFSQVRAMVRFSWGRNRHRFGKDVHVIEADPRDVFEACRGIHTSLAERRY